MRRIIQDLYMTVCGHANVAGLPQPLTAFILRRIRSLSERFLISAAKAITLTKPQSPRRAPSSPTSRETPRTPRPLPPYTLPTLHGWLRRLIPTHFISGYGGQFEYQLLTPEITELLTQHPKLGRPLRPLCRMLGIHLPATLRLPKPSPQPKPCSRNPNPKPRRPHRPSILPPLRRIIDTRPPLFTPQPHAAAFFANFSENS